MPPSISHEAAKLSLARLLHFALKVLWTPLQPHLICEETESLSKGVTFSALSSHHVVWLYNTLLVQVLEYKGKELLFTLTIITTCFFLSLFHFFKLLFGWGVLGIDPEAFTLNYIPSPVFTFEISLAEFELMTLLRPWNSVGIPGGRYHVAPSHRHFCF